MAKYKDSYETNNKARIEQLLQLSRIVWDGDIISKADRDELIRVGLAQKMGYGYNLITPKGVVYLHELGLIHP